MNYNPSVRYFTDMSNEQMLVLHYEMAFQYAEHIGQPLMTVSDSFWLWWSNHWKLIDAELAHCFEQEQGLTTERCRAIHASRHRIDPLHRYPNEVMADRIIEEVFIHYSNHPA
jgi:hypothetical protein